MTWSQRQALPPKPRTSPPCVCPSKAQHSEGGWDPSGQNYTLDPNCIGFKYRTTKQHPPAPPCICRPPQHMGGKSTCLNSIQQTTSLLTPDHSRHTPNRCSRGICPRRACWENYYPNLPRIRELSRAKPFLLLIPHHTPTLGCALRGKATLGSICKRRDTLNLGITYSLGWPCNLQLASFVTGHRSKRDHNSFR